MDVAIQVQSILLGDERVIFKPIGVIKGHYNKKRGVFIDEYQYEYVDMYSSSMYDDRCFCCPTTMVELMNGFGQKEENILLGDFLDAFLDICYVGFYDVYNATTHLFQFNFSKLEEKLMQDKKVGSDDQKQILEFYSDDKNFVFDENALRDLRNKKSIEEVRAYIDEILAIKSYVEENFCADTKNKKHKSTDSMKNTKNNISLKKEESSKFNLKDMRDFVLSEIIAQDDAVRRITTCIMSNLDSSNPKRKSHLLLTGPTGTGKSKTIQLICEYLDIPYVKVDSTDYTQAGYVGRSVDEMLQRLVEAADGDIEKAQKGILVIDEIDKKASKDDKGDIATKAVMDSLLKITGRGIVQVDIVDEGTKFTIDFDTSNLTVIFTGAFEGIEKLEKEFGEDHKVVGFIKDEGIKKQKTLNIQKQLIKYGMTPELIGRIKCIVPLKSLDEKDYVQILKYSKSSPLLIEKDYYENDKGIKFTFTSNYVKELAKQAQDLNVGARGLESVVSKSLEDIQERVLNREKIKALKLTKKTALNNKEYYFEK